MSIILLTVQIYEKDKFHELIQPGVYTKGLGA